MTESEAVQVIKAYIEAKAKDRRLRDFIPFDPLEMRKERDRAYEARPERRAYKRAYDKVYNEDPGRKAYKRFYDKARRLLRKERNEEARLRPRGPCHWVAVIDGVTY